MEKLIELLNEYVESLGLKNYVGFHSEKVVMNSNLMIISRKWGFIKWLLDNDKIDLDKLDKPEYIDLGDDFMKLSDSDYLIMLLSIQDNPIDFLCSILKD